jgi:hypothetical protein
VATAKTQTSAPPSVYSGVPARKGQFVVGKLFIDIFKVGFLSSMSLEIIPGVRTGNT